MRKLTAGLMMMLAATVVLFGGADSEADCNAGECFDLAYEIALEPDGADIRVRPGAAEDLAGRIDEGAVRARLQAYADAGIGQETQAETD
jgi:hypothetical protein